MRFSLKDLMWSVTLASLGVASASIALKKDWPNDDNQILMMLPLVWAPGILLGASIGRLFHRPIIGMAYGVLVEASLFVIVGAWIGL